MPYERSSESESSNSGTSQKGVRERGGSYSSKAGRCKTDGSELGVGGGNGSLLNRLFSFASKGPAPGESSSCKTDPISSSN